MTNETTGNQEQTSDGSGQTDAQKEQNKKNMEHHRLAAAHHTKAARHHWEAAADYDAGDQEKADVHSILAYECSAKAAGFLSDDAKYHAQLLKQTNHHY